MTNLHSQNLIRTIGVVAKSSSERAQNATRMLLEYLDKEHIPYRVDREIAGELGIDRERPEIVVPREELSKQTEVIVVLGGDGTLISVSRHPANPAPIIVGVNVGTLGFLTEITIEETIATLKTVLAGTAKIEQRGMLAASVRRGGKVIANYTAVNDVVITKEALARIFEVTMEVNNEAASIVRGDGLIIATPGGSTAYSLAAGGSIVHPQVKAILITPICPHSLTSRPLVIPGDSEISCVIKSELLGKENRVYLTIDGQEGMALNTNDEVVVTTSPHHVCFAKSPSKNYFEILGTKLKWAQN